MSFEFAAATPIDLEKARLLSSAMRKTGRPVVLVVLGTVFHAGQRALLQAARRIPRGVVIVAWAGELTGPTGSTETTGPAADFAAESVDAVLTYSPEQLWPRGLRTQVRPAHLGLSDPESLAAQLTLHLSLIGATNPTHVIVGEKDYEQAVALQQALKDLQLSPVVHIAPTVRSFDGLALSARNAQLDESDQERALTVAAAVHAGTFAARFGAEAAREAALGVLSSAGLTADYVEVRGRDLGDPPPSGDARLLLAATIGGVQLLDNAPIALNIDPTATDD